MDLACLYKCMYIKTNVTPHFRPVVDCCVVLVVFIYVVIQMFKIFELLLQHVPSFRIRIGKWPWVMAFLMQLCSSIPIVHTQFQFPIILLLPLLSSVSAYKPQLKTEVQYVHISTYVLTTSIINIIQVLGYIVGTVFVFGIHPIPTPTPTNSQFPFPISLLLISLST